MISFTDEVLMNHWISSDLSKTTQLTPSRLYLPNSIYTDIRKQISLHYKYVLKRIDKRRTCKNVCPLIKPVKLKYFSLYHSFV